MRANEVRRDVQHPPGPRCVCCHGAWPRGHKELVENVFFANGKFTPLAKREARLVKLLMDGPKTYNEIVAELTLSVDSYNKKLWLKRALENKSSANSLLRIVGWEIVRVIDGTETSLELMERR